MSMQARPNFILQQISDQTLLKVELTGADLENNLGGGSCTNLFLTLGTGGSEGVLNPQMGSGSPRSQR